MYEPHRKARARRVRLIVVEAGTLGLEAHAATQTIEETVVIAQVAHESVTSLASRVRRRILVLERGHQLVEQAILLLSPRDDEEAIAGRLLVIGELVEHLVALQAPCLEFVLSAGSGSRDEVHMQCASWRACR